MSFAKSKTKRFQEPKTVSPSPTRYFQTGKGEEKKTEAEKLLFQQQNHHQSAAVINNMVSQFRLERQRSEETIKDLQRKLEEKQNKLEQIERDLQEGKLIPVGTLAVFEDQD